MTHKSEKRMSIESEHRKRKRDQSTDSTQIFYDGYKLTISKQPAKRARIVNGVIMS